MKLYVEVTEDRKASPGLERLIKFTSGRGVYADLRDASFRLQLGNGRQVYLCGEVFYHVKPDSEIKLIGQGSEKYLKKIFAENPLKEVISSLEGQYIGLYVDTQGGLLHIFSDRYARLDSFYACKGPDFYFSTDLDFIFKHVTPEYDQKMLAHLFCVYGWYTPKGLTIYKNVKQLKVGEIITLSESGIRSEVIEFKPLEIEDYTDKDLELYYKILRESVIARASRKGKNWVSSSSGWDSSVILGLLVDEFGPKNVGMLTGSMKYSERAEIFNEFEISKINKIGRYYGIRPIIIDFDFKSKTAPDYWGKVMPYYKSRHMYTYVTYNFARLSDRLYDVAGEGQVVFNGETSDSFHNFGFSQFATFFHTKKSFTEYADKMNCYLYGPSFFKKVIDGTHERDRVFQIFKKMTEGVEFASQWNSREEIVESYLFPFFYGSPRIPFAMTYKNPALTQKGQEAICHFPFGEYMPEVLNGLADNNLYSWLIFLYHSFHAQGSTVNIHKHSMEYHNHRWRSPYDDIRLIDVLSRAPEEWGRGLELNSTKYPLKWVARNRIKFPYELLDEGSHAYLWDVIEGLSLFAEITYRSGVTEFFRDAVKSKSYKNILSDEYFNMEYLDALCTDYLTGKEARGKDFNNLVSLITLSIVGWY